ncbi:endonuclease/exonuclease/phosphatase family protein [Selenomonas ruminantium]|uniref:endonuclease/exonuclease/phosphatase family protein n=1 Tax=Selenomonas ruminantium TaxID=971 RepID=UPI0026EEC490|nr:endonuclease/exonuclease/phosphatase family protein [Selenomonas ruminantium]
MKIATWNIERLKHKKNIYEILRICNELQADILVLTETDEQVRPNFRYEFHTEKVIDTQVKYNPTENRVSIYTNYPCVARHETFDKYTAVCVEIKTEYGNILVYGTVIGVLGGRNSQYDEEVRNNMRDIRRLSKLGNICVCGDYNCSFSDSYYFTKKARKEIKATFEDNGISILTEEHSQCIDHIAISTNLIACKEPSIIEWNVDKRLSDHKGIMVDMNISYE